MGQEILESKPRNLYICPPISANELLGTTLPDPYNYDLPFGIRPIHFYKMRGRNAVHIIGVQEGYIGGRQINQLLRTIKPEKAALAWDILDLLNDWIVIDRPENEARRKRHEEMGECWQAFSRDKMMFWDLINSALIRDGVAKWREEDPNVGAKGVIWWRINDDSTKEAVFAQIASQAKSMALKSIIRSHLTKGEKPQLLSTTLGVWLLAYFSPEIRSDESVWKPRDSYNPGSVDQNMGTTQVGVMTLRYAEHFLGGKFIPAAEEYIFSTAN